MGSVVDFGNAKRTNGNLKSNVCRPPIEVSRINGHSMLVEFRKSLFNGERLHGVLSNLFKYQDYWRMVLVNSSMIEYYDPYFYGYIVYTVYADSVDAGDVLSQAMYLMTMVAYRAESQMKFLKDHSLRELIKPQKLQSIADSSISFTTVKTLSQANILTVYDLVSLTREELCEIPGMTTIEIYKIERALASVGWFLTTSKIPSC